MPQPKYVSGDEVSKKRAAFHEMKKTALVRITADQDVRTSGRPPTEAGLDGQGDHVLPYALVERGFTNHFRVNSRDPDLQYSVASVAVSEEDAVEEGGAGPGDEEGADPDDFVEGDKPLDDDQIDQSINTKRDKIIGYINHIAVLENQSMKLMYGLPDKEASSGSSAATSAVLNKGGGGGAKARDGVDTSEFASVAEDVDEVSSAAKPDMSVINSYMNQQLDTYMKQRVRKTFLRKEEGKLKHKARVMANQGFQDEDIKEILNKSEYPVADLISSFKGDTVSGNRRGVLNKVRKELDQKKSEGNLTLKEVRYIAANYELDYCGKIRQQVAAHRLSNKVHVIRLCEVLSETAGAYYNRLPGVAYKTVDKVVPYPADRLSEKEALEYLDDRFACGGDKAETAATTGWTDPLTARLKRDILDCETRVAEVKDMSPEQRVPRSNIKNNKTVKMLREKLIPKGIKLKNKLGDGGITLDRVLEGMLDYGEVKEEVFSKKTVDRNNRIGPLTFYMARLIHVTRGVYPSITKTYKDEQEFREKVVNPFIDRMINRYWPTLKGQYKKDSKAIHTLVHNKMDVLDPRLQKELKEAPHGAEEKQSNPEYSSSGDEDYEAVDVTTKHRQKIEAAALKTTAGSAGADDLEYRVAVVSDGESNDSAFVGNMLDAAIEISTVAQGPECVGRATSAPDWVGVGQQAATHQQAATDESETSNTNEGDADLDNSSPSITQ